MVGPGQASGVGEGKVGAGAYAGGVSYELVLVPRVRSGKQTHPITASRVPLRGSLFHGGSHALVPSHKNNPRPQVPLPPNDLSRRRKSEDEE